VTPLKGAPAVRRLKSYSASSGYVYQYVYEGCRRRGAATEYVFAISAGRDSYHRIPVLLEDAVLAAWAAAHRPLAGAEPYALAKLALLAALDERSPEDLASAVIPGVDEISAHAATLDL
jgi:hypothetical protein